MTASCQISFLQNKEAKFGIINNESITDLTGKVSGANTLKALIENKGIPVFVDVEPESLCIDPKKIISAITKKTKMILPVHFGGMPCNLNEIQKISKKHNLDIVEDAAHSAGSVYNNNKIGRHGKAVCFSFHPVKNLAMPTGGLISINDPRYK